MISGGYLSIHIVICAMSCEDCVSKSVRQAHNAAKYLTRRRAMATLGAAIVGALAGCVGFIENGESSEEYERLQERPVYFAANVDLSVPDEVWTVDAPTDADLVVLPDTPDTEVSQGVEWIKQGRAIALLGDDAQNTWLSWIQSDVYVETFGREDFGVGEPEPNVLVAWDAGSVVTTSRSTIDSGLTDRTVLSTLDEALGDIPE